MNKSDEQKASSLISYLLSDPDGFARDGSGNSLLGQFLCGYPIDRLGPLLRHENVVVVRRAIWIASELSQRVFPLLPDVITLSDHPDSYVRYYALDCIILNTIDGRQEEFARVVEKLEDSDSRISGKAVRLIARASDNQLAAAMQVFEKNYPLSLHISGLSVMLKARSIDPEDIKLMINSSESLERKYGLSAADRLYNLFPHLLELATFSSDEFIKEKAAAMIKIRLAGKKKDPDSVH